MLYVRIFAKDATPKSSIGIFGLGYRDKCQLKKPSPQYPQKWETIVTLISPKYPSYIPTNSSPKMGILQKSVFFQKETIPPEKNRNGRLPGRSLRREKPGKPGHQVSRESGPLSPKERKPKSRRSWNLKRPSVDGVDFTKAGNSKGFNVSSWKT